MAAGGVALAVLLTALVFMLGRQTGPIGTPAAARAPAAPESAPPATAPAAMPQASPEATRPITPETAVAPATDPAPAQVPDAASPMPPAAATAPVTQAAATPAPNVPNVPAAPSPASPAEPGAPAESTGRPLLDARLAATREWLAGATAETVSIQIMGAPSEEQLERQLRNLSRQVEGGQLYVFRTRAGTRPSLTVLYGAFGSRREAAAALAALPESIRSFSPHLRTVRGVRAEIAASGS
jgi:septal ring-binding cell division protein DamX